MNNLDTSAARNRNKMEKDPFRRKGRRKKKNSKPRT